MSEAPFDGDGYGMDEDLSALIDGELDAEREAQVRAAIAESPALAARLQALRAVGEALSALPAPTVPERLEARVLSLASAEDRAPARGAFRTPARRRLRWAAAAPVALAAGLALFLSVGRAPDLAGERGAELAALDLEQLPDEELEIARDFETLADLDVIEQLELLELLDALDEDRG